MSFVHLSARTHYSIHDGVCQVEDLLKTADKYGMSRVAITDSCNMFGALEAHKVSKKYNCNPIYGAQIWLWPEGLKKINSLTPDGGWHLSFLIKDRTGYENLSALITAAIFDGMHYRPRIDLELLRKHKDGLIATTCNLNGPIGSELVKRNLNIESSKKHAIRNIELIQDIFGDDLYIELGDYAIRGQSEHCSLARIVSKETGVKTIVTNDVRYINPIDAVTLESLRAINKNILLDSVNLQNSTDQQYFKSQNEMEDLFPEDIDSINRTQEIAEQCQFQFKEAPPYFFPATTPPVPDAKIPDSIPKAKTRMDLREYWANDRKNWEYFYNAFPPPKSFNMPNPENEPVPEKPEDVGNMCSYFEWYCKKGLEVRLEKYKNLPKDKTEDDYWKRLDFEMNIIEEMGFPAYMLIVAEFINWSKDNDIPVGPGRGSAAGSIVAWAMGITDVDPLKYNLLFERFLNPERVSMPDIDIDFCQAKRKLAIEHVQKKYGKELVSQIITYGKLAARAAVKDACRILGIPFMTSNDIAKMVPEKVGIKISEVLEDKNVSARINLDPLIARVFTLAKKLEGTTRQVGVHAAGVVIADRPLVEHSPMYKDWTDPDSMPVIQYDMGSSETIGLIKFDFLGLKTLDQIDQTVKFVKSIHNKSIEMSEINLEDNETYSLLSKGDTVGVFQLESSGMQALMKSMKPQSIEDVIASIALYRPGPLSSGMDKSFVECKEDPEKIEYLDPRLEQILDTTYGSMVYQEQVMQIAQELAGYSLGEADLLRRAMGKKKKSEMEMQKIRFVKGFSKMVDYSERSSEQVGSDIFDLMAYFAGYGFNKSHSAAYGLISYQTAWLKAHYRVEYFAALMIIENDNTDKIQVLIEDCILNDIRILPPNVNDSYDIFEPVPALNSIKYSLAAIKRIGQNSATSIFEARKRCGGKFKDFQHFLEEVDKKALNKKVIENLIKCGAFDWTGKSRACLFESYPDALKVVEGNKSGNDSMQLSLFAPEIVEQKIEYKKVKEWDSETKARYELEAIGFYITSHPMSSHSNKLIRQGGKSIIQILKLCPSGQYYTCGLIKNIKNINTKSKSKMQVITIEDGTASIEIVAFESSLNNIGTKFQEGNGIIINVEKKINESNGAFSYYLSDLEDTIYFTKSKKEA